MEPTARDENNKKKLSSIELFSFKKVMLSSEISVYISLSLLEIKVKIYIIKFTTI